MGTVPKPATLCSTRAPAAAHRHPAPAIDEGYPKAPPEHLEAIRNSLHLSTKASVETGYGRARLRNSAREARQDFNLILTRDAPARASCWAGRPRISWNTVAHCTRTSATVCEFSPRTDDNWPAVRTTAGAAQTHG
jgi:hypothetical protein